MNLVFFDFDDTVTTVDTTLPYAAFFARESSRHPRAYPLVLSLLLARFGGRSNTGLKRDFCRRILRGLEAAEVRVLAQRFHDEMLPVLLDDALIGALRMHAGRGDAVFLVSANFECLFEPMVDAWCLGGVIATRAELKDGRYTGELEGAACHGEEKLLRLEARFGRAAIERAVAYGNRDDSPVLRAVRTAYLVRRVRRPGVFERIRLWRRILAGRLQRRDCEHPRVIEPFARPATPVAPGS